MFSVFNRLLNQILRKRRFLEVPLNEFPDIARLIILREGKETVGGLLLKTRF